MLPQPDASRQRPSCAMRTGKPVASAVWRALELIEALQRVKSANIANWRTPVAALLPASTTRRTVQRIQSLVNRAGAPVRDVCSRQRTPLDRRGRAYVPRPVDGPRQADEHRLR